MRTGEQRRESECEVSGQPVVSLVYSTFLVQVHQILVTVIQHETR